MASIVGSAVVQVTTYDSGPSGPCAVTGWGAVSTSLQATVVCRTLAGALQNSDFNLIVTHPNRPVNGTFDYSFVYTATGSGTLTSWQYNSSHKKNSVRHLGTGKYQVTLGGPTTKGTHGIVKLTALGNQAGDCELISWAGSAKGEVVNVDCYGVGHVARNREFIVTYAAASSLMGANDQVVANAFADSKAAVDQPAVQYDSRRGARVTVVHYSTGSYEVLAAGSSGDAAEWGGDVQVNAVDNKGRHCGVTSWSQELTPAIYIRCVDRQGQVVDSPFTVEWVVP